MEYLNLPSTTKHGNSGQGQLPQLSQSQIDEILEIPAVQDVDVEAEIIAEHAKNDIDVLAALAMPEVYEFSYPPVLVSIWLWITALAHKQRDFSKLAIGLPRGFAKSTLFKLFIVYCVIFTKKQFILVLSATEGMACNIIQDACDMLSEPNITKLFGNWETNKEIDNNRIKKFYFRGRWIIIAGLGAEGKVRGLNLKNARPDVMVFDDVQSREDADSELVSEKLKKWMQGTAMKAKSPKGCLTMFIANMYPTPHSILKKLQNEKSWVKWIAGGLLYNSKTGEISSLWEDLQPKEQLLQEFENDLDAGDPETFYAEVLNDPNASVNKKVDISKLKDYPYDEHEIHQGNFIIIDPATGKTHGDDVTIAYAEVHQGIPCAMDLDYGKFSPAENIWIALRMAMEKRCGLIFVEANAYQSTLAYWFKFIMEQAGIEGIEVIPIYSGSTSKNSRILTMFKSLMAGELILHPKFRPAAILQITSFAPLRTDNTDGILDCLTYMTRILVEFADALANSTVIEMQEFNAVKIEYDPRINSPF